MRIEFGLKRTKLVLSELSVPLDGHRSQCYQCVPVEHVQIRKRMRDPWTQYAITMDAVHRGKPASIQGNHDDHQIATSGVHVRSTLRQSMPSKSIESCARLSCTVPLSAFGQMNRPRSRRLANRHRPSPSHHKSLTMSPRRPRNTNTCPENGCSCNTFCTCALNPSKPRRRSVTPAAIQIFGPDRKLDHWRRLSRIEHTRDESAPLSTLITARPGSSM